MTPVPLISLYSAIAALLISGLLLSSSPVALERVRGALDCSQGWLRSIAILQIVVSIFLIIPPTRIWGIVSGVGLMLEIGVVFFLHRRSMWCIPVAGLALALGCSALTIE